MKLPLVAVVALLFIRWNIGIIETKPPATNNLLTTPGSGVSAGPYL
jgi:hypothetical protein